MEKYWENETPVEITTEKNVLRYYKKAGKLQISNPSWTNKDGEVKQGKTVTLDLAALKGSDEGRELLRKIVEE